jgi:hypothetical protein
MIRLYKIAHDKSPDSMTPQFVGKFDSELDAYLHVEKTESQFVSDIVEDTSFFIVKNSRVFYLVLAPGGFGWEADDGEEPIFA